MSNTKYMYKTNNSCIAIKDDKLYIISTKYKDYSARAVTIIPGFQIELGRKINDIESALKETRLPIILKKVTEINGSKYIQIIRMHTGKVDDKIVATILCRDEMILSVSFNRELLRDSNYRKYTQLSIYHQISIPFDLSKTEFNNRTEQVKCILKNTISVTNPIEVCENGNSMYAITNEDEQKLKFMFISNKNNGNRYELASISLQK